MSKAEELFNKLGMEKKETQEIVNGKITKHTIVFEKISRYEYAGTEITNVKFDMLRKRLNSLNEHGNHEIEIVVASYEMLKELGWINE